MKRFLFFLILSLIARVVLESEPAGAQSTPVAPVNRPSAQEPATKAPAAEEKVSLDKRAAAVLYQEANDYLRQRFAEFNAKKLPYDPKMEAQTRQ